jgi:hypothetical protein
MEYDFLCPTLETRSGGVMGYKMILVAVTRLRVPPATLFRRTRRTQCSGIMPQSVRYGSWGC